MLSLTLQTFCKLLLLSEPHAFLPVMLHWISKMRWVAILRWLSLQYALHWASQVMLAVKYLPSNAGNITSVGSISVKNICKWKGVNINACIWHTWKEKILDREAWRAAVHGVTKSPTRLHDWATTKRPPGHKRVLWSWQVNQLLRSKNAFSRMEVWVSEKPSQASLL